MARQGGVMKHDTTTARYTLTVAEAGQALNLGRQSIYELIRTGRLRAIHVGRKIIIPRDAIDEFLRPAAS